MKKFYFLLLSFLALSLCANAAEKTGTITFGSSDVSINTASVNATDELGTSWTITTVGTTSFTPNAAYAQIGSGSKPATSITFVATLPATVKVNSVEAKFGGFSGTAGAISIKVGDTKVGAGSLNASTDVTVNSTTAATSNTLTISITGIKKGVKAYYITYTYEESNATVESISIDGVASRTIYEAGEAFSTAGLKVFAAMSDETTNEVTSAAVWEIQPEALTIGTTTVKVTATYQEKTASKDINVTVVAEMPTATLDLSTTNQVTEATDDKLVWNVSDIFTVVTEKTGSTKVTNYYPGTTGQTYTQTRFYTGNTLTIIPAANYQIVSITYIGVKDPAQFANSSWTNASATLDGSNVTVDPEDGTQPIVAIIAGTTGASSMVIKYRVLTVIETETGLDAVLKGTVSGKYQINTPLRVNYKDANYAYASTTKGGFTKTAPTEAQKKEWWSDEEGKFNQNDWVAISGLDVEVGAEIEAGSVATLVSKSEFPVIKFDTMKSAPETAIAANTYRVANFNIGVESPLVSKLWLVAPQPAEHCFVKGYIDVDYVYDDYLIIHSTESVNADEYVTMKVYYTGAKDTFTANNWYLFEGIVVNGPQLKAVSYQVGSATGVEGVETSSVKVYGAEGVINVESEEVAPIAVYSANGAIVSSVEASSASIAVAPGFYIVKAGNSVSKVTVK